VQDRVAQIVTSASEICAKTTQRRSALNTLLQPRNVLDEHVVGKRRDHDATKFREKIPARVDTST
jgi:hypothetical protein